MFYGSVNFHVSFLCTLCVSISYECHVVCFPSTASILPTSQTVKSPSSPQTVGTTSPPQMGGTTSPSQTVGTTSPPQTVGTASPPQTVGTTSSPQTVGATSPPQTVGTTSPPQTDGATSPQTDGATSLQTVGTTTTTTVPVSSSTQLTKSDEATMTPSLLHSNMQPTRSNGAITIALSVSHLPQPTKSDEAFIPTGTVSISNIQPTNNPSSDGTTTTSVFIVVAVVIILVVIVVGVVILVVLLRAKKRKQLIEFQNVTTENQDIEMKIKQEGLTEIENNSSTNQPSYAEIQTKAPPKLPTKSEELVDYLNLKSTVTGGYSEIEPEPVDRKHTLPAKPPRQVNPSDPISKEMEPSTMHQNMDQRSDPPSATNHIYTLPDTSRSHTVETNSGKYETVYSEPIEPSLFTDVVETPSDCEDLQPYGPIYTVPTEMPKSDKVILKFSGSNIREIRELGMGQFGKVILAETVGLSAKDLRLSESDDDKSKSTLVAVKKLKSDAPNATKEAFEKEVNFMSRLTDRNIIHILGVCFEDTPFIMMEYMEKGDLNQYLQKFKTLSTTDSEPPSQITASTLVHMATQIASAMKYLVSHNFVHRDLATRNCLVGPNYLVKISDFGMSRSLYGSHYYRIHGRFSLPVRWMAYECFYGKFSQKSDVWAFGVTMWEIFTLAKEQPYNYMSDKQVVEDALKGKNRKTLARPDMCPLKVYKIMLECWEHNSDQRATFEELFQLLTSVCQNV